MHYYDATASSYNGLHGHEQLEKAGIIKRELNPSGLLLDVGAGTGIATAVFHDCCDCIALEPSSEMLSMYKGFGIVGRAEGMPFKGNSFDAVVSLTALHHCNLEKAVSEILRVAKPEAKIGISFFKRAANFSEAERLFAGWARVETRFDSIFFRK